MLLVIPFNTTKNGGWSLQKKKAIRRLKTLKQALYIGEWSRNLSNALRFYDLRRQIVRMYLLNVSLADAARTQCYCRYNFLFPLVFWRVKVYLDFLFVSKFKLLTCCRFWTKSYQKYSNCLDCSKAITVRLFLHFLALCGLTQSKQNIFVKIAGNCRLRTLLHAFQSTITKTTTCLVIVRAH